MRKVVSTVPGAEMLTDRSWTTARAVLIEGLAAWREYAYPPPRAARTATAATPAMMRPFFMVQLLGWWSGDPFRAARNATRLARTKAGSGVTVNEPALAPRTRSTAVDKAAMLRTMMST
ncbi:hypothetical protein SDC9_122054 [bioreactor metagenome]|uniref:Uncharacterized protein n=1 Tax=bioreactor metagenome TaxID=1076179 RepID=A0A645CDS4_9ZZZZ